VRADDSVKQLGDAWVIVLDTHVWIWWVDDHPRLRREIRDRIDREHDLRISAISILEIATASSLGRLELRPSAELWLEIAQSASAVTIEPLTAELCLESVRLPGEFHRDPADRLIVALPRQLQAPVCTADGRILAYSHVQRIGAENP
jgi:PIN domain nuclease of toxin-antitoxin system